MAGITAHQFASTILMDLLQVKHIVFGYDNHFGQNREGSKDFIDLYYPRVQTHRVNETLIDDEIVSSSLVKRYLQAGNVQQVTKLLGHYYSLTGMVIKGDQLGQTIGFPTANMKVIDENKLIPSNGVYFTKSQVGNIEYYGMTNIGVRPTVSNTLEQRIETHLFNFDQDIYGKMMVTEFIHRLRDEKKFDSFPALVEQLHQDQQNAKKLLTQIHIAS
jgi:riboflavin kinase/FMN adenylyltransferase